MATKKWEKALERIKTNNPELYKKLTTRTKPKVNAEPKKTEKIDLNKIPPDLLQAVWDLNKKSEKPDVDYIGLLKAYKAANPGASAHEAVKGINKIAPLAREQFVEKQIKEANREPEPIGATYSGDADPLDFKKLVSKYCREYKCSISEAWKLIEADHPGLREAYIKKVNE